MTTRQTLSPHLPAIDTQEPDRAWFDQRPARTRRLRLPNFDDLQDNGTLTTHVIVSRRGVKKLSRVPITVPAYADPFYMGLLMKDTPKDGVQDLAITGLMHTVRSGRRINFDEILDRASRAYR